MLLTAAVARGVADGTVDLAFRRWGHPRIHPGSSFIALTHVIEVASLERVDPERITREEARRAGYDNADAVRAALCVNVHKSDLPHRTAVHRRGPTDRPARRR
ncbi:hypothetical protein O4159_06880 [Gordonia terrae]|uniref:hypothetical protein n=1 Tax=Gordonia hongkongensis TaxID=1701090 RepID=UPI0022B5BDE8|nr:hypothetical protein [Gordonia terrae]